MGRRKAQAQALGWDSADTVRIVDQHWNGRAIDVEVGEFVLVHGVPALEGSCLDDVGVSGAGRLYRASQPGIGKLRAASGWAGYVRVSRKTFVGAASFAIWPKKVVNSRMLVEEHNLSVAWAKVFLTVLKENEVSPVVVVVRDIDDSAPEEIPEVRDALDELLEGERKGPLCNTVANTIFPSIWNPHADRQELYDRYNPDSARLRKDQRNKYGLYFQRLTSYGANGDGRGGVNQLEQSSRHGTRVTIAYSVTGWTVRP